MVTKDQVHTILIFQNLTRASKSLPHLWMNARETPAISDFVHVNSGIHQGKEGWMKMLGVSLNDEYTISLTSSQSTILTIVLESDNIDPPTMSNISSSCVSF